MAKMRLEVSIFSFFACALCGCISASATNVDSVKELRTRAAFEMSCDASSLKFVPVMYSYTLAGVVTQYGVEGCDQRIVYVSTNDGWIANTRSDKQATPSK
jgi:hypothetical protein